MNKTPLWFFWLLLLVPALVVAVFGFRLIAHEQDRTARALELAQLGRVQSVADDLALALQEVTAGLTATLMNLDKTRLESELATMRRSNPIVRNVFLVASNGAVLIPRQGHPADREEELFLQRYEALLAGRIEWGGSKPESAEAQGTPWAVSSSAASRLDLGRLARSKRGYAKPSEVTTGSTLASGWMPWFAGHQLYLLGWVKNSDGSLFGVELETAALLSRLLHVFPQQADADELVLLVDGQGKVMHQVGSAARDSHAPSAQATIGGLLPHWEVQLVSANHGAGAGRFMLVGGLLLCILVSAIVFGGSMLLLQAGRSRKDAMQKTSFVSNVSHELKTPLTTIRMYAEMLGEGRVADETKRVGYLNTIIAESQRLSRLVNNVLDFSRLEQNRQSYKAEAVDLAAVIAEVLETQQDRLRVLGMNVEQETGVGLWVKTDRDALRQTLLNLIDNAAKYAAAGKVLRVEIQDGAAPTVAVLDRGPGVPVGERGKIFERFHRVDSSLTAQQPGCGLGLTLARRMMRDVGADVVYRERDGGGAAFCIVFPAALRVNDSGGAS